MIRFLDSVKGLLSWKKELHFLQEYLFLCQIKVILFSATFANSSLRLIEPLDKKSKEPQLGQQRFLSTFK